MFGFKKQKEIRIVLGQREFRSLIRGGQVTIKNPDQVDVKIILSDIGFEVMGDEIEEAASDGVSDFKLESIEVSCGH